MMEYSPRRSMIHDLNPLTKLLWSLVVFILALLFNDPWYLAALVISVVVVGFLGKVGKAIVLYLGALVALSSMIFIFQVLFQPGGRVLFTVFPADWPVVGGWLSITEGGVLFGIAMSLRVMCMVSPFAVIVSTTQPRDIIMALVDKVHVPYDYAFLFTTTLRFMPVIAAEVATITQAQRSRAYAVEGWNPIRKVKAVIPILMPIVFIAIEKADRLGLCMELRGYGNKNRTHLHSFELRLMDQIAVALLLIVAVAGIVAALTGHGKMFIPQ